MPNPSYVALLRKDIQSLDYTATHLRDAGEYGEAECCTEIMGRLTSLAALLERVTPEVIADGLAAGRKAIRELRAARQRVGELEHAKALADEAIGSIAYELGLVDDAGDTVRPDEIITEIIAWRMRAEANDDSLTGCAKKVLTLHNDLLAARQRIAALEGEHHA